MGEIVSRRSKRELTKKMNQPFYRKKSTSILGTALVACSVAMPIMTVVHTPVAQAAVTTSQQTFINNVGSCAQTVAASHDLYASVMIAQAILESGWGGSALAQAPNYNLFGVKGSYNGNSVTMPTQEYLNGTWLTMDQPFRQYPSYVESCEDNAAVLSQGYYYGAWKSNTSSYQDATQFLTGLYATAPNYATSLNGIIQAYNLTQYDTPSTGTNTNTNVSTGTGSGSGTVSTASTYTVQSGDSVWGIANSHGISMSDLISWNGISNNFIYPGQVLKVSAGSSSTSNTTGGSNASSTGNTTTGNAAATYTVKSGDSVWGISNSKGISMSDLISWNGISNNFIYPGQVLKVSAGSSSTGTSTPSTGTSTGSTTTNTGTTTNTTTSATYTVKSGDSVWGISNSKGISMSDLISWNGISNNFIYPGQVLKVSAGSSSTGTSTPSTGTSTGSTTTNTGTTTNTTTSATYTVKSGDSVWGISNSKGISMSDLISWNGISNNFIYPGQVLKVSAGSSSSTTSTVTTPVTNNTTSTTTTPTTNTTTGSVKTITVKSGDSVWKIANSNGISMANLISWNNISNNFIYPGQVLKVSAGSSNATTVTTTNTTTPTTATTGKTVTVKAGESVWGISSAHGITMAQLISWNNIQNNFIYPGETLKIAQ